MIPPRAPYKAQRIVRLTQSLYHPHHSTACHIPPSLSISRYQVYVQQPPQKKGGAGAGTGCLACLAGMCCCCLAEDLCLDCMF